MADDLARMEQALKAASDAGDVQAAQALAREMRTMLQQVNPTIDQTDFAAEGAKSTAKETGASEAALVAAGRGADKVVQGMKQAYNAFPQYPLLEGSAEKKRAELAATEASKDQAFRALEKEHPMATAAGEAAPYVAIPPSAGPGAAAATVGAIEASKYGTPGERAGRGFLGAGSTFIGGTIGNAAGRIISPVSGKAASETNQAALDALERVGGKPTLGEATGSPTIRSVEDLVARLPGGRSVMEEHAAGNAAALNRAASRAIGENADELTPEVFSRAASRIGKVFDDVKALPGHPIRLQPNVVTAADDVLRQQMKMLPTQQDPALIKLATEAKNAALSRGRIDGETYQLTRSGLSEAAFDATGTNKTLYGKLLDALDSSADASLRAAGNDALADSLKTARQQYANLKVLEKGATAQGGDVSAAKVASTLRTNNPGAFRRGRYLGSDMGDIAYIGENLPNLRAGSPTAEREALMNPVSAALYYAFSKPMAHVLTSDIATLYPRTLGKTAGARAVSEIANPATRAAVAAALARSSGLLPVPAEQ